MRDETACDVAVIGAGLSGLVTAALLAREGHRVRVFDGASQAGGRARSPSLAGLAVNLGPHALFNGGAARAALAELGVEVKGSAPPTEGSMGVRGGECVPLPTSPMTLLSTSLLTLAERLSWVKLVGPLLAGHITATPHETVDQWLERSTSSAAVRELMLTLVRLTTYANAPAQVSARSTARQVSLGLRQNVAYLPFESLVRQLDVKPEYGKAVRHVSREGVLTFDDAVTLNARAVVMAVPLNHAAKMYAQRDLLDFAEGAVPSSAAVLDLVLSSLPKHEVKLGLGVGEPLYASVHREEEGRVVVQVAKYLAPGATGTEAELQAFLSVLQPGWHERVVARRFMPSLVVNSALPLATRKGAGFGTQLSERVFAAADWAVDGFLCDAGIAAGQQVVRALSRSPRRAAS